MIEPIGRDALLPQKRLGPEIQVSLGNPCLSSLFLLHSFPLSLLTASPVSDSEQYHSGCFPVPLTNSQRHLVLHVDLSLLSLKVLLKYF